MEQKTKTDEKIEFAIRRGSVPCVRPQTVDLRKPSAALTVLQRVVTGNLCFSIALAALHFVTPVTLALPLMKLAAVAIHMHGRGQSQATASQLFQPLHLYYMSTIGSDANDGLAPISGGGHGPWASPNHNLVCGDVIVALAGDYSGINLGIMGAVSSCPSSTGGI